MLTEIYCNKFKQNAVTFHDGLNAVLGDSNASNSIGKSTFLLIIDFVFGGDSYAKSSDIISHIGHHEICFTHEFDGCKYYYKRKTEEPMTVIKCEKGYIEESSESVDEYTEWLFAQYKMVKRNLSFRGAVGTYLRIYGKENLNEKAPLQVAIKDKPEAEIKTLLRLFNNFSDCEEQSQKKKEIEEKLSAYKKAQKYNIIDSVTSKKAYDSTCTAIDDLSKQSATLKVWLQANVMNLDAEKIEKIAFLKDIISNLQIIKAELNSRKNRLDSLIHNITKDISINKSNLLSFFPTINIKKIEDVQSFHNGLSSILQSKIESEKNQITDRLTDIINRENSVAEEINSVLQDDNPQKLTIERLIDINNQISALERKRDSYKNLKTYTEEKKNASELYEKLLSGALTETQQNLNNQMKLLHDKVISNTKPPMIRLESKKYDFMCVDDSGTGSSYKGLIIFDLSVLSLTDLPIIAHDTLLLKNISIDVTDNIVRQYNAMTNKQIFIAFDNLDNYSESTQGILNKSHVLKLSPDGYELFGYSWNKSNQL